MSVNVRGGKEVRVDCAQPSVASQLLLLPCFVVLELDPVNVSPLSPGTVYYLL